MHHHTTPHHITSSLYHTITPHHHTTTLSHRIITLPHNTATPSCQHTDFSLLEAADVLVVGVDQNIITTPPPHSVTTVTCTLTFPSMNITTPPHGVTCTMTFPSLNTTPQCYLHTDLSFPEHHPSPHGATCILTFPSLNTTPWCYLHTDLSFPEHHPITPRCYLYTDLSFLEHHPPPHHATCPLTFPEHHHTMLPAH